MTWASVATRAGLVLGIALLAGCGTTTTTTTTTRPLGQPAPSTVGDNTKDRVTQSDESDASKRARVRLELAVAYFGRGQMAVALDEVKLSIAADPRVAAAFNLRGLIYANLGDDALAEESFHRALQIDPQDVDSLQNFGWYLCQKQRYPEADATFGRALALPQYRDSPRTLLARGVCMARAGQWVEAEATLSRAFELDPGNPSIAVNLAEVLYRRNELERARFYIRRVNMRTDLVSAQTLWLATRIEKKIGNASGTQELGAELRSRFPESPEARAFLGGRFDE